MTVLSTGLLSPGLKSEFFDQLSKVPTVYQDLATTIKSNKDKETYGFLGTVPPMREWGTGRKARGLFTEKYDIENLKYEITLEVDRDEISDDQTSQISIRTRQLADRAATHKDLIIAELLANGDQAGFNAYDGKRFFADDHESGNSGVQSNKLAGSAVDPDDPTVQECRTALKGALQQLLTLKDDQGEPVHITASGLNVVCPPAQYMAWLEAVNATVLDSSSNTLQGAARIIPMPRLTDLSKFFLLKTDQSLRPFILQDREPIEWRALEGETEQGFMREKYSYGVRARYRMAFGLWFHALQVDFA